MLRAVKEANDLNAWFNCWAVDGTGDFCKRLKFRTASFCNERSGHFDGKYIDFQATALPGAFLRGFISVFS